MNNNGRVAVITGAGSGIGRHSALALVRAGFSVALAGRHLETLRETILLAGKAGSRMLPVSTDVSDPESVKNLFSRTKKRFRRLDVLFNNAGISSPAILLENLTFEQWHSVIGTNLTGAFLCTQEAFNLMKNQDPTGGRIINNGSVSAWAPRPNSAPYTATKHAITGLTKSTSLDGRKYNISCGQIDIGNAATEMTDKMNEGVRQADGSIVVEPRMDVEDVARAIVYMASLSPDSNVQFMTVMATKMPLVGRG